MDAIKIYLKTYGKYALVAIACLFIFVGVLREEHLVVLQKAINICLECIGVG